jgi:hypothetical protein
MAFNYIDETGKITFFTASALKRKLVTYSGRSTSDEEVVNVLPPTNNNLNIFLNKIGFVVDTVTFQQMKDKIEELFDNIEELDILNILFSMERDHYFSIIYLLFDRTLNITVNELRDIIRMPFYNRTEYLLKYLGYIEDSGSESVLDRIIVKFIEELNKKKDNSSTSILNLTNVNYPAISSRSTGTKFYNKFKNTNAKFGFNMNTIVDNESIEKLKYNFSNKNDEININTSYIFSDFFNHYYPIFILGRTSLPKSNSTVGFFDRSIAKILESKYFSNSNENFTYFDMNVFNFLYWIHNQFKYRTDSLDIINQGVSKIFINTEINGSSEDIDVYFNRLRAEYKYDSNDTGVANVTKKLIQFNSLNLRAATKCIFDGYSNNVDNDAQYKYQTRFNASRKFFNSLDKLNNSFLTGNRIFKIILKEDPTKYLSYKITKIDIPRYNNGIPEHGILDIEFLTDLSSPDLFEFVDDKEVILEVYRQTPTGVSYIPSDSEKYNFSYIQYPLVRNFLNDIFATRTDINKKDKNYILELLISKKNLNSTTNSIVASNQILQNKINELLKFNIQFDKLNMLSSFNNETDYFKSLLKNKINELDIQSLELESFGLSWEDVEDFLDELIEADDLNESIYNEDSVANPSRNILNIFYIDLFKQYLVYLKNPTATNFNFNIGNNGSLYNLIIYLKEYFININRAIDELKNSRVLDAYLVTFIARNQEIANNNDVSAYYNSYTKLNNENKKCIRDYWG